MQNVLNRISVQEILIVIGCAILGYYGVLRYTSLMAIYLTMAFFTSISFNPENKRKGIGFMNVKNLRSWVTYTVFFVFITIVAGRGII